MIQYPEAFDNDVFYHKHCIFNQKFKFVQNEFKIKRAPIICRRIGSQKEDSKRRERVALVGKGDANGSLNIVE